MSEDKKGWEFADGLECLSYHQKNSSWTGKLLSNLYSGLVHRIKKSDFLTKSLKCTLKSFKI